MKHFFTFTLIFQFFFTNAQLPSIHSSCGTDELTQSLLDQGTLDPAAHLAYSAAIQHWTQNNLGPYGSISVQSLTGSSQCDSARYIVPVVVHIVHSSGTTVGTAENIDSLQVVNQLDALNDKMGRSGPFDTEIRFVLAKRAPDGTPSSGILRHSSTRFTDIEFNSDSAAAMFDMYNWDENRYVNIYVVKSILDSDGSGGWQASTIGGYSFLPITIGYQSQGIVAVHNWFGVAGVNTNWPLDTDSEGEVLVHEVGHYLGLYHPWQGKCNGGTSVDCATEGDLCCDVAQSQFVVTSCTPINTCASSTGDAIHNYMSYTGDGCRSEFTPDQTRLMYATLDMYRSQLWNPKNVNTIAAEGCLWTAQFVGPRIACAGDSVEYTAYDIGTGVLYTWTLTNAAGVTTTATGSSTYGSVINTPGRYAVQLTITDPATNDSRSFTMPDSLEVAQCQPLASTQANWLFGDHAGLHFYANKVIRSIGPMQNVPNIASFEGSAAVSDSAGRLIGYIGGTDISNNELNGLRVFGKNYLPMINETVNGSGSSSQSSIFVPYHADTSRYHLITRGMPVVSSTDNTLIPVFDRHIIDKDESLITFSEERLGKVTSRNQGIKDTLGNTPGADEAISAIKRCDDSTYWLTIINPDSAAAEYYIVGDTGVRFSHRVSVYLSPDYRAGFIKYSPDGRWVWLGNSLYRFCRQDASISLVFSDSLQNNDRQYGISFSPDSKLLYIVGAKYKGGGSPGADSSFNSYLYQYRVTDTDVGASRRIISDLSDIDDIQAHNYSRGLQIGPDGKIYVAAFGQPYLGVIHKPNERVLTRNECEYESVGTVLSVGSDGGISKSGLPNFIDARGPNEGVQGFNVKNVACLSKEFIPSTCCASSYLWHFGNGDSSTAEQPVYIYDSAGIYTVSLIIANDTITKSIKVGLLSGDFTIEGDDILCSTGEYTYSVNPNKDFSYTWLVDGGSGLAALNQIEVSWGDSGTLKLYVEELSSGCTDSSKLKVRRRENVDLDYKYATSNCSDYKFSTELACDNNYLWNFGDGTSSSEQNPEHTYFSEGSYIVSLTVGSTTITKTILVGLGSNDLAISGDTVNCDDSTLFDYQVNPNPNFIFEWSASGTSTFTSVENEASAVWERSGSISVIGFNTTNGCRDTNTIQVNKQRPDTIIFTSTITNCTDVQFATADYCSLEKVWHFGDGDSSVLQNPSHTYDQRGSYKVVLCVDGDTTSTWLHLQNDILPVIEGPIVICDPSLSYDYNLNNVTSSATYTWSALNGSISNPNGQLEAVAQFAASGEVQVEASNDIGCRDTLSLVVEQKPELVNTISANAPHCYPDSSSFILGNLPQGGNGTYSYQWYSSSTNSNFVPIPNDTVIHHYLLDIIQPAPYFFRKVTSGDCESESNVVQTGVSFDKNEISLSSMPCAVGSSVTLLGTESGRTHYGNHWAIWAWETSTDSITWTGNSQYANYSAANRANFLSFNTLLSESQIFVRRKILGIGGVGLCPGISNVIKIAPVITITQQPFDKLLCEPSSSVLDFTIGIQDDSNRVQSVTAELKAQGASSYTVLGPATSSNTYQYTSNKPVNYTGVDTFRFKIETTNCTIYSRKAIINTNIVGDIWFRDSKNDNGVEPNPYSSHYDIVRSPDIWNRINTDASLEHQRCEYKALTPNQLGIIVRNRGAETTVPTPLYLYWTLGQINNEEWDIRWLDEPNNQFYNAIDGQDYPMGSRVNVAPIMVPPIAPRDSIILRQEWYPPKPDWYYKKDASGNKVGDFGGKLSVCLLARLEHCEGYPHKMTYPEVFGQHVRVNAARNNNIITKNIWVVDSVSGDLVDNDGDGTIDWTGGSWTGMGRQGPNSGHIDICFDELTPDFFEHWNIGIEVEEEVRAALLNSPVNTGITYLGNDIFFFVDSVTFVNCIKEIILPVDKPFFFRPLFAPIGDWGNLPMQKFEIGVSQSNSTSTIDGAGSFLIDNTTGFFTSLPGSSGEDLPLEEESDHLLLSPNPTSGEFEVQLDEETKINLDGNVGTIIVADGYGYIHIQMNNIEATAVTSISLLGYKAGVYNVRFEIGGQVFYKYVVKTDE